MYILYESSKYYFICDDLEEVSDKINRLKLDISQFKLLKEVDMTSELVSLKIRKQNEDALSFKE